MPEMELPKTLSVLILVTHYHAHHSTHTTIILILSSHSPLSHQFRQTSKKVKKKMQIQAFAVMQKAFGVMQKAVLGASAPVNCQVSETTKLVD